MLIIDRQALTNFDKERREKRREAENDIGVALYELLEFDRFSPSFNNATLRSAFECSMTGSLAGCFPYWTRHIILARCGNVSC